MFDKKDYMRKYRKKYKERQKALDAAWRAANPDKVKEYNHRQYLRRKALKKAAGDDSGEISDGSDTA